LKMAFKCIGEKMKSLSNTLNDIEKMLKDDFNIFMTSDSLENFTETVEYYSPEGDWEKFLEIPRKLNIKIIYVFYLTGDDLNLRKYKNNIGLIELGFYYNNVMHIFKITTEWYDEYDSFSHEEDEKNID